jgi:16S rRNA (cytosine967-C5)-methyltransferase
VLAADAARPDSWWDGKPFDRILLDAPCTATGVIRRHPDIKLLRRASDVAQTTALQAVLLDALWPLLAPGGLLLYATCSVLKAENEMQVAAFLQRHPEAREQVIDAAWGEARPHGRQILTGASDGFFYALLARA